MDDTKIEIFKLQAEICKTLSDYKRLMIIHCLRDGEMSVGQIVSDLDIPQSNVSQHLANLRERGVVVTRRKGATIYYSLSSPLIGQACDMVQKVLNDQLTRKQALADSIGSK